MGLGKTTSTIIASLETKSKKILIICPASLKINWKREIENYTDRSIYICEGKNFEDGHDYTIINYAYREYACGYSNKVNFRYQFP